MNCLGVLAKIRNSVTIRVSINRVVLVIAKFLWLILIINGFLNQPNKFGDYARHTTIFLFLTLLIPFQNIINAQTQSKVYSEEFGAMGTYFEIKIISNNAAHAKLSLQKAKHEIEKIEALISSWNPDSQTSVINQNTDNQLVKVDFELFSLIERSQKISKLTNGAFDISSGILMEDWKFDGSMSQLPSRKNMRKKARKVNYRCIQLNPKDTSIFLKKKGMKIGFGAIGKGYAANKIKIYLINLGFDNGLVNAGGDLTAWGKNEKGEPWKIGIPSPIQSQKFIRIIPIKNQAVVTSGNSEKFVLVNGKRYSHILNPKTGYPVRGLKSVTIIHKNAEFADAMATAIFVLGRKKGLKLLKELEGIYWIIIDNSNNIFESKSNWND